MSSHPVDVDSMIGRASIERLNRRLICGLRRGSVLGPSSTNAYLGSATAGECYRISVSDKQLFPVVNLRASHHSLTALSCGGRDNHVLIH
jgi:hypothetical protein